MPARRSRQQQHIWSNPVLSRVYIFPSSPRAVIFDTVSPDVLYLPYAIGTHGAHSHPTAFKHDWARQRASTTITLRSRAKGNYEPRAVGNHLGPYRQFFCVRTAQAARSGRKFGQSPEGNSPGVQYDSSDGPRQGRLHRNSTFSHKDVFRLGWQFRPWRG